MRTTNEKISWIMKTQVISPSSQSERKNNQEKRTAREQNHNNVHVSDTVKGVCQTLVLLSELTNLYYQHSCQVMEINSEDDIKRVKEWITQEKSRPSTHTTKCSLCKKNNWPCVSLPGQYAIVMWSALKSFGISKARQAILMKRPMSF